MGRVHRHCKVSFPKLMSHVVVICWRNSGQIYSNWAIQINAKLFIFTNKTQRFGSHIVINFRKPLSRVNNYPQGSVNMFSCAPWQKCLCVCMCMTMCMHCMHAWTCSALRRNCIALLFFSRFFSSLSAQSKAAAPPEWQLPGHPAPHLAAPKLLSLKSICPVRLPHSVSPPIDPRVACNKLVVSPSWSGRVHKGLSWTQRQLAEISSHSVPRGHTVTKVTEGGIKLKAWLDSVCYSSTVHSLY